MLQTVNDECEVDVHDDPGPSQNSTCDTLASVFTVEEDSKDNACTVSSSICFCFLFFFTNCCGFTEQAKMQNISIVRCEQNVSKIKMSRKNCVFYIRVFFSIFSSWFFFLLLNLWIGTHNKYNE